MGYDVRDRVQGKRLEIRAGDQKIIVDREDLALYVPPRGDARARYRGGRVYLLIDDKQLEMTIPVAVKVGFALAKNGGAARALGGAVVLFQINGERYTLLPAVAEQLGAVLMRKADRADDWQRGIPQTFTA